MLTGGCQCGDVRYKSDGAPLGLYVCHCRECQKLSVSAFSLSLLVPRAGFLVTSGRPKSWIRPTDSGNSLVCFFCPTCGSRVWHDAPHEPETITIKAGSLDQPPDLSGAIHIWTSRRLPGVPIPDGAEQWPKEPG
ncbi:MAG: GFA family protein [Geminicoccaceae bacterium]